MEVIVIQALGVIIFLCGTIDLSIKIRNVPEKRTAEITSRISHLLFWSCLVLPGIAGFFYPGLRHYDGLLGVTSLPWPTIAFMVGLLILLLGLGFLISSNQSLIRLGRGTMAFLLTEQMVNGQLYQWTRNPMSLGYYISCVGIALMAGSSVLLLGTLLVVVPIHIFNLRYFEESELSIRYGKAYFEYKNLVPFLIPRFLHFREICSKRMQ
jgi:protein-S-isoprenylcysteine O-methyltransferase Ste14